MKLGCYILLLAGVLLSTTLSSRSISYKEVLALRALQESIDDGSSSILSDWSHNDSDPCKWKGVFCTNARDHVLALNLSHQSLKGAISPKVGSFTFLKELNLSHNLFHGVIPNNIGTLRSLLVLDLSDNRLSGTIPPEIKHLTRITTINLRFNGLTGVIPREIGDLLNLVELRLDRNKLHGLILGTERPTSHKRATGLCSLKKLKIGDFSYNFFNGKIPGCLGYLSRTNFQGNCLNDKDSSLQRSIHICGHFQDAQGNGISNRDQNSVRNQQRPHQRKWLLTSVIITGSVFIITLVAVAVTALNRYGPRSFGKIFWKRDTDQSKKLTKLTCPEIPKNVSIIRWQDLEVACEDFSNIIESSSPGTVVYKGTMKDGNEIAVVAICIPEDNWDSSLELYFRSEVASLARLNHENTACMLGYCKEDSPFTRMLVFKYASNGTLYEHLHYGGGCQLLWSKRMRIAIGVARGLKYLHVDMQPPFTFSDIRSGLVYLTEDFHPKLVDFERWKVVFSESENRYVSNNQGAIFGIHDSLRKCHVDVQQNTFGFGLLLLEIVSGRFPYCKDKGYLLDWAMEYLGRPEMLCHLIDPELKYFNHDDLGVICSVVNLCIQPEPFKRPSMDVLLSMLEDGIDTSVSANLKESSLAWAELALFST